MEQGYDFALVLLSVVTPPEREELGSASAVFVKGECGLADVVAAVRALLRPDETNSQILKPTLEVASA